jgi:hypothetical protein
MPPLFPNVSQISSDRVLQCHPNCTGVAGGLNS